MSDKMNMTKPTTIQSKLTKIINLEKTIQIKTIKPQSTIVITLSQTINIKKKFFSGKLTFNVPLSQIHQFSKQTEIKKEEPKKKKKKRRN